jgi:hypothetical protein
MPPRSFLIRTACLIPPLPGSTPQAARVGVCEAFFVVFPHLFVARPCKTHVRLPGTPMYQANVPLL